MHGIRPFGSIIAALLNSVGSLIGDAADPRRGVIGMRNLFGPLAPNDYYAGLAAMVPEQRPFASTPATPPDGALLPDNAMLAHVIMPRLTDLQEQLRKRLERPGNNFWTDRLIPATGEASASEDWENPSIPSGYTYLLQLVAHDTVHSSATMAPDTTPIPVLQNVRQRPLMLDTIYGGGPDASAAAYELDARHRDSRGNYPRTRLRLGPQRRLSPDSVTSDCPFRDIGRSTTTAWAGPSPEPLCDDGGLDNPNRLRWATEISIADQRNDAHPLVSQMTVLFHLFHNQVMETLEQRPPRLTVPASELASRRFLAARTGVTLAYRNIIIADVLRRILHPIIYAHYTAPGSALLDPAPGVPIEFAYAAFRFGHAMVRDDYRTNSEHAAPMKHGLKQTSMRGQGFVPVSNAWIVDWARFFYTGTIDPNLSRRIGPEYATAVRSADTFSNPTENQSLSLPSRDLMAAGFAGIWSVPKLYARLQQAVAETPMATLLPSYPVWRALIAQWLAMPSGSGLPSMTQREAVAIASDPPLAFFVLFEAGHTLASGTPTRTGGGRHLGPVGSIIVAETLFGALRNQRVGVEAAGPTLDAQLAATAQGLLADGDALSALSTIASMPELLRFMARAGAFAQPT